jgi:hypothetical protein
MITGDPVRMEREIGCDHEVRASGSRVRRLCARLPGC